jgi:hypothetical protein
MRKYYILAFFLELSVVAYSQTDDAYAHHCFFEENSITVGLGVPYSLDLNLGGINARAYYNLGEQFCFGPEVSFFKNNKIELLDFNLIAHYIFETKWIGIYPLVGLNYTSEQFDLETENAFGVVFGVGVHRNFKKVTAFAEYNRVESELPDQFITLGLMYNIKWK